MIRALTVEAPPAERSRADAKTDYTERVLAIKGTLYAAAMAITQNAQDAEDAVSEAVLRGFLKLDSLKKPEYFATWLTRIVINTAITSRRKRRASAPLLIDVPAAGQRTDEKLDIQRAIAALDEKTRVVCVLYYFERMTIPQIAKAVGAREGTIKSRLFRAREKLREVLVGYEYGK